MPVVTIDYAIVVLWRLIILSLWVNLYFILAPEECGRAGDIKGLHQQAAHIGNVAGGKLANAGAWPWHAIVCRRTIRVLQVERRGSV